MLSAVPSRATEVEETFTLMKFLAGSTVPVITTEAMEIADVMIMPGLWRLWRQWKS
jgi:hypothetical protein